MTTLFTRELQLSKYPSEINVIYVTEERAEDVLTWDYDTNNAGTCVVNITECKVLPHLVKRRVQA